MQCLRLSAFERRTRLDAQSGASPRYHQLLLAGVRSGGSEDSSGGVVEIADVVDEDGGEIFLADPLEPSCIDEGEGRSSCRRSRGQPLESNCIDEGKG